MDTTTIGSRVGSFLQSSRRWAVLSLAGAAFAMAVAAAATLGAGESFVGEAVVALERADAPDLQEENGLETVQALGAIVPTLAERARSDAVLETVAAAVDPSESLRDTRNRVTAVVLPDTLAIRVRAEFSNEDDALVATEALVEAFVADIAATGPGEAAFVQGEVIQAPSTFANRPAVIRSVVIAG